MIDIIEILSSSSEQEEDWHDALEGGLEDVVLIEGSTKESPKETVELTLDQIIPNILEMIPDVALDYLESLVGTYLEKGDPKLCVESVIHTLFEAPPYPKSESSKGLKRKRGNSDSQEEPSLKETRPMVDYGSKERPFKGGAHYSTLAMNQICIDFPLIPMTHIKMTFRKNNNLYAPTHLQLLKDQSSTNPPYKVKSSKSKVSAKCIAMDQEYLAEREWLENRLGQELAQKLADEDQGDVGGVDCGCCFSSHSFVSIEKKDDITMRLINC